MKIPPHAIIATEKLTHYLLVPQPTNDKSKYLAQAGFDQSNVDLLTAEIRRVALDGESAVSRVNEHGVYYTVSGSLNGPAGIALPVKLIWIERLDGVISFVTLIPGSVE